MDATIIAGSLNDKELKSSIDALVSYVDKKIGSMATNFDNELKRMKESLKNLGDIKVDSGGASDAGSSRRTKRNSEEAKSVRETTIAYDQLATAVQNTTKTKSAEQSFYAFIQNYREHAAKLASELKTMPSASLDRQMVEYQRFEREINAVQRKIQELRQQLNDIGGKPSTSRFEVKAITDEIYRLQTLIRQLTSEQILSTRRIAEADNAAMVQKRALYERTVQLVKELTTEQANSTIATQRQQKQSFDELNAYIRQNIQREQERRDAIRQTGVAARETAKQLIRSAHEQASAQGNSPITGIKELTVAVEQMKRAYFDMTATEKASPIGLALEADIKRANEAITVIKKYNQSLLGVGQNESHRITNASTLESLRASLKVLTDQYNKLTVAELNAGKGDALIQHFQDTTRAAQILQKTLNRPVSLKAALTGDERTLDDIAYKMQRLRSYRQGIDLTKPNAANEIKQVDEALARLQNDSDKWMSKSQGMIASNSALGRSFEFIKNRIAFVLTIGTMTQFTKSIYEIRGQYELLERSIGILFDSMQQGSHIFAELNAMAIKSPFTTMELGTAAKQLSAYDIAAKDVVDTTRRLADMAAAVGIPIERLTYALGQVKAYGYLNARDARMFANAGIPLVQNLADMYTKLEGRLVSVGDIYDRIKKKAISFEDVLKVVNEMTGEGGRFFNFQEKAADTLKVKLANLTLAYNNMLNEIGKSNQTLITAPLVGLKKVYENWRSINNIISSLVLTYGLLKGAQILYIAYTSKVSIATASADVASKKLVGTLYAMKGALVSLASNPFTWITAVLASLGYMYFQMRDLDEATEQFNKSISDNAKENIESINKFFNEYQKDIVTINSLSATDQQKMWERIREEIEKTSKNALQYIEILEQIPDLSTRVTRASDYLSQLQEIQKEAQRLAEHGFFSVGGGFADDGLADDLAEYEAALNELIKDYGSLEAAEEHFGGRRRTLGDINWNNQWGDYIDALRASQKELNDFSSTLDNANISKIMGDGDAQTQLANIREFATIVRDNFLATEKGQKTTTEGRVLLNQKLDEWISKQGVANELLDSESAKIEAHKTAWEVFFDQLNKKDKETVDYLVETNQTGSEEFKKIWDKAADSMKESSISAYQSIQEQIATLRNTPDIVIRVVYKQNKEQLDDQQQQFKEDFLTPKGQGVLSAENYLKQVQELTTKYGRFQKKENENNVEWEKRLGETYRDNESSLKRLNEQLENSANLSDVDRKAKEGERDALIAENKVLDEVKTKQNFNYEKDKKDKKDKKGRKDEDIVAEALKQELQLIKEIQSNYDKLRKSGVSNMDAIDLASKGYEATIIRINQVLSKFGIDKFNAANFAGKDVRSLLQSLEEQRNALLKSGKVKTSSLIALDGVIKDLRIDVKTDDMKKVTDGLNSELGKIKDEYELAVELDANPELGDIFAQMLGIDTSTMPHSIDEYMDKVRMDVDKARMGLGYGIGIDIFGASEDEWQRWAEWVGISNEKMQEFRAMFEPARSVVKKWATDVVNNTKKLEYELDELNDKIAIKEKEQAQLHERIEKEKNEATKHYLELTYQSNEKAIDELRSQALSLMPEYARVFNSIAEYSAGVSRRLQRDLMRVFDEAKYDSANKKWTLTGSDGKQTILNDTQYRKEREKLTKEMRKSQSPFKKIKEAFKPSDKNGVVDYAKGIELISGEVQKLGSVASEVGNLAQIFGADEQTVEIINDVATSLNGVATAGQGISQIASGDYIGGAASLLSGITSVIGAWADNGNKKIDAEIKESELAVKRLENAYKDLEYQINKSYGTAKYAMERTAIANKELQLVELQRQLALEKSRDSKNRDASRIADLEGQIIDLKNQIKQAAEDITNDLLGISSVGNAAENLVTSMIEAFKAGEDYMLKFDESFENMIDNMVMKAIVGRIIGERIQELWDKVDAIAKERASNEQSSIDNLINQISDTDKEIAKYEEMQSSWWYKKGLGREEVDQNLTALRALKSFQEKALEMAQEEYEKAATPTPADIEEVRGDAKSWRDSVKEEFDAYMAAFGIKFGEKGDSKQLSLLQQGIQGVTEDTAGAIEAYMNIVAQRVFEQNLYLQEIRDHLNDFDLDVQLGTLSQMLLQLQQSYQVQQNIESILTGVLNPSGRAIVVELNS